MCTYSSRQTPLISLRSSIKFSGNRSCFPATPPVVHSSSTTTHTHIPLLPLLHTLPSISQLNPAVSDDDGDVNGSRRRRGAVVVTHNRDNNGVRWGVTTAECLPCRSLDTWSLHREELVVVGLDRDYLIKHL
ncbi:hypothetical protein HanPSC8_Chr09g0358391 [Helianthus annuus]|nr:hypothetical protein HanPSC8_Chr09g0358391 [Helianthus annuus]